MEHEEAARLAGWAARLLQEGVARAASELGELVPQESRAHLLKAQRELLLAAAAAVEHRRRHQGSPARHRPHKIVLD
jgi:hypothetical protein